MSGCAKSRRSGCVPMTATAAYWNGFALEAIGTGVDQTAAEPVRFNLRLLRLRVCFADHAREAGGAAKREGTKTASPLRSDNPPVCRRGVLPGDVLQACGLARSTARPVHTRTSRRTLPLLRGRREQAVQELDRQAAGDPNVGVRSGDGHRLERFDDWGHLRIAHGA